MELEYSMIIFPVFKNYFPCMKTDTHSFLFFGQNICKKSVMCSIFFHPPLFLDYSIYFLKKSLFCDFCNRFFFFNPVILLTKLQIRNPHINKYHTKLEDAHYEDYRYYQIRRR